MAETKDKILVLFDFDAEGYITGWQDEFFDGKEWQTPFDTSKAVEVAPADLAAVVPGATKLTDGKLVLDEAKKAELEAVKPEPSQAEIIAKLQADNATMQGALLELSDLVFTVDDPASGGDAK